MLYTGYSPCALPRLTNLILIKILCIIYYIIPMLQERKLKPIRMSNSTSEITQDFHSGHLAAESFCLMLHTLASLSQCQSTWSAHLNIPLFQVFSLSHSQNNDFKPAHHLFLPLLADVLAHPHWGKVQESIRNPFVCPPLHPPTALCTLPSPHVMVEEVSLFLWKTVSPLYLRPFLSYLPRFNGPG